MHCLEHPPFLMVQNVLNLKIQHRTKNVNFIKAFLDPYNINLGFLLCIPAFQLYKFHVFRFFKLPYRDDRKLLKEKNTEIPQELIMREGMASQNTEQKIKYETLSMKFWGEIKRSSRTASHKFSQLYFLYHCDTIHIKISFLDLIFEMWCLTPYCFLLRLSLTPSLQSFLAPMLLGSFF